MFQVHMWMMLLLLNGACVVRFSNAERSLDQSLRNVYVPSSTDSSTLGGNSGRLSVAIRKRLADDTRIRLSSMDEASWALDVRVQSRNNITTEWVDCAEQPAGKPVASGSEACGPNLGFNQSNISSEQEQVSLSVIAKAVDLNTGKIFKSKSYSVSSSNFQVVGDDTVKGALSRVPQIHALRYAENTDKSVEHAATQIANMIVADFFP